MRTKKGFTLIELLASMAIIAVLIGMAGFGISLALRSSRDSQRQKSLDNLKIAITDYLGRENKFPDPSDIEYSNGEFVISTTKGDPIRVPAEGLLQPATTGTTTSSQTEYCYGTVSGGYVLGVKLENGSWYELGSAISESCANGDGVRLD